MNYASSLSWAEAESALTQLAGVFFQPPGDVPEGQLRPDGQFPPGCPVPSASRQSRNHHLIHR